MSRLKAGDRAEGFKSHRGRSEKKLEKPLDKPRRLWYNGGKKEGKPPSGKNPEVLVKYLLGNNIRLDKLP